MLARRYGELTGQRVEGCRFRVLRDDDVHGWLGASPDGLIDGLLAQPGAGKPSCAAERGVSMVPYPGAAQERVWTCALAQARV